MTECVLKNDNPASILVNVDKGVDQTRWQTRPGQDMAVRSGSPETRIVDHVALAILRSQAVQGWFWHRKRYWNRRLVTLEKKQKQEK
jgi:hypothetical protein